MAYAYPAAADLASSVQVNSGSTPTITGSTNSGGVAGGTAGGGGVGSGAGSGGEGKKKTAESVFDVLKEFKHKIDEDDHYISFFQDRIRAEEQYIDNLTRLYDRTVAIDSLHDDVAHRGPRSTLRRAWHEVRDYTQREVEARSAMVGALREDVIARLMAVKDTQSRIRQRIREDMKQSSETYEEYASSKLPKLKRNYFQKSQIVEDIKRQEHAIALQAKLLSAPSSTSPAGTPLSEYPQGGPPYFISGPTPAGPTATANVTSGPGLAETPSFNPSNQSSVTFSAQSLMPAPPSNAKLLNRTRAGSGSGSGNSMDRGETRPKDVLNDIAHQSKKGFNAFMQRLGGDKDKDRGDDSLAFGEGEIGGPGLSRRATGGRDKGAGGAAMKSVRAKREAEEADKAYRYGVFHLESLRIRRDKLQISAITSLEQFNEELNSTLRTTLERYVDTLHGTAATNAQATEVARSAIEAVKLDRDISIFRARLPSLSASQTPPVLYENFYVGPCRSLIFGVSLTDYDFARGEGSDHGRPPAIVEKCIAAIDQRGLQAEGIYRISGRHAGVQETIQKIEMDEEKFVFDEKDDVYSISNVLKQYLRQLPDPVFPLPHAERVKHTENRESHIHSNFSALRGRLRRLPPIHQTTFQAIIEHLGRIQQHSSINKMDSKNLAVVFNAALFGPDQLPTDGNVLMMHQGKDTVLEDLITFSDLLFGTESPIQAPTILPPGSALSRSGVLTYYPPDDGPQPGSSRTKIRILDPGETVAGSVTATSTPTTKSAVPPPLVGESEEPRTSEPNPVGSRFTPDGELDLLFDPQLVPRGLTEGVNADLHARPLSSTDFLRSQFGLLATLAASPPLAPSTYTSLFHTIKSSKNYYIVVMVAKETDQLVATGTLIVERKFIHGAGLAGHIEDIVVGPGMQGRGLGMKLVKGLKDMAVGLGCYKVILDCKEEKIPFYVKCGFVLRGRQMAYYVPETKFSNPSTVPPAIPARNPPIQPPALPPRNSTLPAETTSSGSNDEPDKPPKSIVVSNQDVESDLGSPRTFASASSGSGVTYSYPVNDALIPGNAGETSQTRLGPPQSLIGLVEMEKRSGSPLPPGAEAPVKTEPERIDITE